MAQKKTRKKLKKNPDYVPQLKRLRRVQGQIGGIERMIVDRRYCPDILVQLKAAQAALRAIETEVFKTHLSECVKSAFNSGNSKLIEEKIAEIQTLVTLT